MKFCPKCGKKNKTGALCSKCKPKTPVKDVSITVCECRKYFSKNRWIHFNSIKELIRKITKTDAKIMENIPLKPGLEKKIDIKGDKKKIKVTVKVTLCHNCRKRNSQYYEGILQIRNPYKEVMSFIRQQETKMNKRGIYINRKNEVVNGFDFYFSDSKFLKNFVYQVQSKYGGTVKINSHLYSRDYLTSKNIYRLNAVIRFPEFHVSDVLVVKNSPVMVEKLSKKVIGRNLRTKKRIVFSYGDYEILEKVKTTVSKVYPKLEVLDPETFQSTPTKNQKRLKVGQKVTVVGYKGLYVV
ncbi:hypothetical protein D6745_03365 [Candidatus Woesearchaeota archaeon]|nr:MAG: hypothetical protein D6745_03365 [Candidatus Woesearchaeota archaeon]